MKQRVNALSRPQRGTHWAIAGKQTAHARALALLPIIRTLMETGYVSQHALTDELNRRGITAGPGRKWSRSSIATMLRRLGISTNGKTNTVLAHRRAADARAEETRFDSSGVPGGRPGHSQSLSLARLTNGGFQPHGVASGIQVTSAGCCNVWKGCIPPPPNIAARAVFPPGESDLRIVSRGVV